MILITIYTIFSFILDGLISNYQNINIINPSYLRTIYTVVSLVVIYPYFSNHQKYLYFLIPLGIFFDIVYTNVFIVNIIIFLIIYLVLTKLDYNIPNNLLTINIKSLLSIFIYHTITYLILVFTNYNSYSIKLLLIIISRSIIMTIIYTSISYSIIKKIYYRVYTKKIK